MAGFEGMTGKYFLGVATKTAIGLVPQGNSGGADVSPFKRMRVESDLAAAVHKAKSGA